MLFLSHNQKVQTEGQRLGQVSHIRMAREEQVGILNKTSVETFQTKRV